MIVSALLLAVASPGDCPEPSGADASSKCRLEQSLRQLDDLDCQADDSQMAMNVCSYREYLMADIELNDTWDKIAARYRGDDADDPVWQSILKAQRAWLAFRDAQCEIWREYYKGGTIAPLMSNSCLADLTGQRIAQLQELLEQGN